MKDGRTDFRFLIRIVFAVWTRAKSLYPQILRMWRKGRAQGASVKCVMTLWEWSMKKRIPSRGWFCLQDLIGHYWEDFTDLIAKSLKPIRLAFVRHQRRHPRKKDCEDSCVYVAVLPSYQVDAEMNIGGGVQPPETLSFNFKQKDPRSLWTLELAEGTQVYLAPT
ncbi:UNVERIFIED_CONTAM: hypothetical protein K2H54_059358 [Gekko kuhli]